MPVENEGHSGKVPEFSVGVSDAVLLTVSGIGFVFLAASIYSIIITRLKSSEEIEGEENDLSYEEKLANADVSNLTRSQRRARARHIMKQQRRVVAPAMGPAGENIEAIEEEQEDSTIDPSLPKLSRKDRQKAAKAAEKEERKIFEEKRKHLQKEAQEAAQREKKEKERTTNLNAEKERQARQERRQAEEMAAYQNWKTFLSSPDGSVSVSVNEWIKELETSRLAQVDKLAGRFQTTKEDVLSRIKELLASSRITGVLEVDGLFIYISQDEMSTIASVVRNEDKTTLHQLSKQTNDIISQ